MLKHSTNPSSVNATNGKLRNSYNSLNNTIPFVNNSINHVKYQQHQQQNNNKNNDNNNDNGSNESSKNGRSASLPLKIMLNKNGTSEKIIKSWNGDSSASLINKYLDHLNGRSASTTNGNIFLTCRYNQLSLSEHFLNLFQEESVDQSIKNLRMLAAANNNKNKLIKFNYNINSLTNGDGDYFNLKLNKNNSINHNKIIEETKNIQEENDKNNNLVLKSEITKTTENDLINENTSITATSEQPLECSNDSTNKSNDTEVRRISGDIDNNNIKEIQSCSTPINNSLNDHNETLTLSQEEQQPTEIANDNKVSQTEVLPPESVVSTTQLVTVTNSNESSISFDSSNSSSGIYSNSSNSDQDISKSTKIEESNSLISENLNVTSDTTILDDNLSTSTSNTNAIEEAIADEEFSSSLYEEELEYRKFLPKKSCLASKSKLFIDLTGVGENSNELTLAATSSPLIPSSPLGSPDFSLSITSSINSSELNSSSTLATTTNTTTSSSASKKRVLFADTCGKELFTVRTMNEPSNCPPKLTSKIVQYFLNREFDRSNSLSRTNSTEFNTYGGSQYPIQNQLQLQMQSRNYDYGISGFNYSNDSNKHNLRGSIAFYSLNFAQPAADYMKFKQRLDNNCVSLENVLLNSFKINGTIKVKNINFHKHVFVRCTFNGWSTYEDVQTQFVSYDFYSSPNSTSSIFYSGNNYHHEAVSNRHKEYDTFRFEFQLPKTVSNQEAGTNSSNKDNVTGSIQFCICYRTGNGDEAKEFWDSNDGKNYEILQYVIDLDQSSTATKSASSSQNGLLTKSTSQKANFFKFDINNYKSNGNKTNNFLNNNINLSNNYMPAEEIYY
jgi:hypothetical protein